jgi:hypothetical protein
MMKKTERDKVILNKNKGYNMLKEVTIFKIISQIKIL